MYECSLSDAELDVSQAFELNLGNPSDWSDTQRVYAGFEGPNA